MKIIITAFLILVVVSCTSDRDSSEPGSFDYPEAVQLTKIAERDQFDDNHLFANPNYVLPLENGSFVVADLQTLSLYLFDEHFSPLDVFGRSGRGPGEFLRFSDFSIRNSSLNVFDGQSYLISNIEIEDNSLHFTGADDVTHISHPDHPAAMFWRFMEGTDGHHIAFYYDFNISSQEDLKYSKIAVFPYSSSYEPEEEAPSIVFELTPELEYENGTLHIPYLKRGYIASIKDHIVYATSDDPYVQLYNRNGENVQTIELPDTGIELTRSQKQEAYELMYANSPDPERFRSVVMPYIPDIRPIVRSVHTDADERIWVHIYRDDAGEDWLVFEKDGTPLVTLSLPGGHTFSNAQNNRIFTRENTDEGINIAVWEWYEQ